MAYAVSRSESANRSASKGPSRRSVEDAAQNSWAWRTAVRIRRRHAPKLTIRDAESVQDPRLRCFLRLPGRPRFGQQAEIPLSVRNDVTQADTEVLVLRHRKLRKSGHEAYFRPSREGVWPWFERIGSRVVGQWKVIHPDGSQEDAAYDNEYRLARYAN